MNSIVIDIQIVDKDDQLPLASANGKRNLGTQAESRSLQKF